MLHSSEWERLARSCLVGQEHLKVLLDEGADEGLRLVHSCTCSLPLYLVGT